MLVNLRNYLKYTLGRQHLLLKLYAFKKQNRPLIINPDKDICIEGYPRSANTYAVLLVQRCAQGTSVKIDIAHHMHGSSQLKMAVFYKIPAILLIRKPIEAIASHLLREKGISIKTAINWYNVFYKDIKYLKNDLMIWDFDNLIANPSYFINSLNKKINGFSFDASLIDDEEIFKKIDDLDRYYKKKDFDLVSTRPNIKKLESKQYWIDKIMSSEKYSNMLSISKTLYNYFKI